jgi:hypothetical protein
MPQALCDVLHSCGFGARARGAARGARSASNWSSGEDASDRAFIGRISPENNELAVDNLYLEGLERQQ